MRQISRFTFALLISGLSVGLAETARAQSNTKNGQRPTQPAMPAAQKAQSGTTKQAPTGQAARPPRVEEDRPAAKPSADEETTPELDEILDRWETESAKIKKIHGTQSRSEFNGVFGTEKVSKGPFFLEMPDRGRIDMGAVKFKKTDVSQSKTKSGDPYQLESAESTRWICTGEFLLIIDDDKKTWQREEIPENQRGANIINSPLPFLFGMKAEVAKDRFQLKLKKDSKDYCQILAVPRMEKDRQNYQAALITLNKKNYVPTQVRLRNPDGQNDVVYTFENVKVNDKSLLAQIFGDDPYRPSLKGYTKFIPSDDPVEITPASNKAASKDGKNTQGAIAPRRPMQSATSNNNGTSLK